MRTRYRIALTQAVRDECKFFERPNGAHERIDLTAEIDVGEVELIEVTTREFARFQARFDPGYVERLDDGECESLAYLTQNTNAVECAVCSADKIVWRVLGNLHLREHGISLEEMLSACGLTAAVPAHYSKAFREEWTRKGFTEGLQGIGRP